MRLRWLPESAKLSAILCDKTETGLRPIRLEKDQVEATGTRIVFFDWSVRSCQKSRVLLLKNWVQPSGFVVHHCLNHFEALQDVGCERGCGLILSGFDGHQASIANTTIDALFQEIGDAIEFRSSALGQLVLRPGRLQDVTHFVVESITSPKRNHALLIINLGEITGEAQESACRLHGLLLVVGKRGASAKEEPIKVQS